MQWTRKPQEQDGSYMFSGQFIVTSNVMAKIPPNEIYAMYNDIQNFVKENNGGDYLHVFENGAGDTLYLIDELDKEMIESGQYDPEDNHCTLLFSWEY